MTKSLRLVVALAVGSLAVWQGVAGAARTSSAAIPVASIELHNENCGDTTGAAVIGTVRFERRKLKLSIRWRVTSGPPRTKYYVSLWEYAPAHCVKLADLGTVKTNSKGVANQTFFYKGSLAGITSVFVDGYDGSFDNDSIHVAI